MAFLIGGESVKLNISKEKFENFTEEERAILKDKYSFHSDTKLWHSKEDVSSEEAFEVSKQLNIYPTVTWAPTKQQYSKLSKKQKEDIIAVMKYNPKAAVWESRQNCGEQATYVLRALGEKPYLDYDDALKDKLLKGMEQIKTSEEYVKYLTTMSKFINYSPHNQILIALQNPQAELIASRSKWQKDFERKINPSAAGIMILAPNIKKQPVVTDEEKKLIEEGKLDEKTLPTKEVLTGFRAVRVYDVSDTTGKELPEAPVKKLTGDVENFEKLKDIIIKVANPYSVEFVSQNTLGKANGLCDFTSKSIKVSDSLSPAQTIKTMLHELSHANMHERSDELDVHQKLDKKTKELQAESAAFMLCQRYGIDSSDYSFGYVTVWTAGKSPDEIYNALEASSQAAKSIARKIDAGISLWQRQEQKNEQSLGATSTPMQDQGIEMTMRM